MCVGNVFRSNHMPAEEFENCTNGCNVIQVVGPDGDFVKKQYNV